MAIKTALSHFDGFFAVHLTEPPLPHADVLDYPDDRAWPFEFSYADAKFAAGEREFLGIEVLDTSNITDYWLAELDKLDLPRVDVPEAGLTDVSIADVLRWARETFPSRYSSATA